MMAAPSSMPICATRSARRQDVCAEREYGGWIEKNFYPVYTDTRKRVVGLTYYPKVAPA